MLIGKGGAVLTGFEWGSALIAIGAGFPLGYLLQSVFRAFFVRCLLPRLVIAEGDAVNDAIGKESFAEHFGSYEANERAVAAAWAFEIFLNSDENKGYQKRLLYLIAAIHAAGGVISAIFFSHIAVVLTYLYVYEKNHMVVGLNMLKSVVFDLKNPRVIAITLIIFIIIVASLIIVLSDYQRSLRLSMRSFILSRGGAFKQFLTEHK